jgi:hypothetical protein
MNLEKYLVVGGAPGVHKLVANRSNGLVIEDRHEGRTRFVPVRQQQMTPLATVAVYTESEEGTVPLSEVFQKMLDQREAIPPVGPNASSTELRDYFSAVLPEHDRDRVHINDIKKCVKWFTFMLEKGIFAEIQRDADKKAAEAAEAETTSESETTEKETKHVAKQKSL